MCKSVVKFKKKTNYFRLKNSFVPFFALQKIANGLIIYSIFGNFSFNLFQNTENWLKLKWSFSIAQFLLKKVKN